MSAERAKTLFERYGTRAEQIATFIGQGQDASLKSLPTYSRREIGFIAQHEKIAHLDDFLLRRSMLAMLGRLTREVVGEIAGILAEYKNWDEKQKNAEVARALEILSDRHQVRL